MNSILYYPYINIPRTDWTMRTLLYYDTIGTIVPQEYFYDPQNHYEPFMYELIRNELVVPINPMNSLDHPWEVSRSFLKFIRSSDFRGILNRYNRRSISSKELSHKIHRGKFEYTGARIHVDKFEYEIFETLEELGLARPLNENWYAVEERTASFLMTFLANIIGQKLEMLPTSDTMIRSPFMKKREQQDIISYDSKRNLILKDLIPFPSEIDILKLRRFKDRYLKELNLFKNKIEQVVLNPTIKENSPLFEEILLDLRDSRDSLSARMNESRFNGVFFGSVCGIVGALYGLSTSSTMGAVLGGIPGFANAIYSALQIENPDNIFDQSGMKYLALVDKRIR